MVNQTVNQENLRNLNKDFFWISQTQGFVLIYLFLTSENSTIFLKKVLMVVFDFGEKADDELLV
jgi:hypothetical protein